MKDWRLIPDWPAYEVSSWGEVRSVDRRIKSPVGNSGFRFYRGRAVIGRKQRRYPHSSTVYHWVTLYNGKHKQPIAVHALVLLAFVGPRPDGMKCRHLDGNGLNNRLSNICWGTPQDNEADKGAHGTKLIGEKHHQAKLTRVDVEAIRASPLTSPHVAKLFNIHEGTVRQIRRGRTWAHLLGMEHQT